MVIKTTAEVIQELRRGANREANYRFLFEQYSAPLYRFFRRKGVLPEDCNDLTQEVFVSVFRGLKDLRDAAQFHVWIFKIATNFYKNDAERRRAKKRAATEVPLEVANDPEESERPAGEGGNRDDSPVEALIRKERLETLSEALRQLPPQMRRCVYLRVVEGFSNADIAADLGVTISTVKAHLYRARQLLRKRLEHSLSGIEI